MESTTSSTGNRPHHALGPVARIGGFESSQAQAQPALAAILRRPARAEAESVRVRIDFDIHESR